MNEYKKSIEWLDRPDWVTIDTAFDTYRTSRRVKTLSPILNELPYLSETDFYLYLATSSVLIWDTRKVIEEKVYNQPLHKDLSNLEETKEFWKDNNTLWEENKANILRMYHSTEKFSPIIYLKANDEYVCLAGVYQSIICNLTRNPIRICVITLVLKPRLTNETHLQIKDDISISGDRQNTLAIPFLHEITSSRRRLESPVVNSERTNVSSEQVSFAQIIKGIGCILILYIIIGCMFHPK